MPAKGIRFIPLFNDAPYFKLLNTTRLPPTSPESETHTSEHEISTSSCKKCEGKGCTSCQKKPPTFRQAIIQPSLCLKVQIISLSERSLEAQFDQRVQLIASADPMEFSFFGIFQGAVAYLAGTFRMYAARSLAAIRLLEILFAAVNLLGLEALTVAPISFVLKLYG
ncbi:hypothetical protein BDZ45DRAFT_751989 [Acephala macrosclerotiorum]|nr:hypothetical protein BDZ45DRAFT_751989 [Acephala macrosclerotiorum]